MEDLNIKQMMLAAKTIAAEKNLPEEKVLEVIEMAIAAAWRRENGNRDQNVRAELNTETGEAEVFVQYEVVDGEEAYNINNEISLEDAKEFDSNTEIGEIVEEKFPVETFGRVAAQTAKQVVLQRLREAEREIILEEFEDKVGTIVSGSVSKIDQRFVRIDLGKASGIMPLREQINGEYFSVGQRIKVLIKEIEREGRAPELILSRSDAKFVEILFEQEVPELETGMVEIVAIAREAGRRTKMAVRSVMNGVDPVGTFVGSRGVRVQSVMNEIGERAKAVEKKLRGNVEDGLFNALSEATESEVVKNLDGDESDREKFGGEEQ